MTLEAIKQLEVEESSSIDERPTSELKLDLGTRNSFRNRLAILLSAAFLTACGPINDNNKPNNGQVTSTFEQKEGNDIIKDVSVSCQIGRDNEIITSVILLSQDRPSEVEVFITPKDNNENTVGSSIHGLIDLKEVEKKVYKQIGQLPDGAKKIIIRTVIKWPDGRQKERVVENDIDFPEFSSR